MKNTQVLCCHDTDEKKYFVCVECIFNAKVKYSALENKYKTLRAQLVEENGQLRLPGL